MKNSLSHHAKRFIQFNCFLAIASMLVVFALTYSLSTGGDHIWRAHLRAGTLLVRGLVPALPAYPMWGYSLLAGILGAKVLFFQAFMTLLVLSLWHRSVVDIERRENRVCLIDAVMALIFAPWIFLAVSYYSNSMGQILVFAGTWLVYLAVVKNGKGNGLGKVILSGWLLGLAANIRNEYILFVGLISMSLLLYGLYDHNLTQGLVRSGLLMASVLLCMIPWLIYTNATLGSPRLTSTNGGAVRYHGLGVLPDNPWNVISRDLFVKDIAEKELSSSPWSREADDYFSEAFVKAVTDYPAAFVMRVATGWKLLMMQGLYMPDLRSWAAQSSDDAVLYDYGHELTKQKLGLNVNVYEMNQYREQGIDEGDLAFRHFLVLIAEYSLRFVFLIIFVCLLLFSGLNILRRRLHPFLALLCITATVYLFALSGLVQANPRHTTLLLPFLLGAILLCQHRMRHSDLGN